MEDSMKSIILLLCVAACVAQKPGAVAPPAAAPAAPADPWKTATQLPNVDFAGITADQKQQVLKLLREENCTCGCGMKMAECRMKDPKCVFSRMSSEAAIKTLKEGKGVDAMRKAALAEDHLKKLDVAVKIKTDGEPSKGPANAKITLVEFSDFQCPYCSQAAAKLDELLKRHPNDVRLVYRHYPIYLIHSQAKLAARASLAAHAQGKFWPMHDLMFRNNEKLSQENILAWAKQIGLNMDKFNKDLESPAIAKALDSSIKEADEIGVLGTPTVFLNGQRYNGELDPAELGKVVDEELKKK
jgi:protein-disulfide isomerase